MQESTVTGLLFGGAAVGLLATMWTRIKGLAWRLAGLFVQRVEIPTEAGHEAVIAYLIANFRRSRNYDRMYGASWEYQRDGRYGLIPYEVFGNRTLILWSGWFPFLFSNQVENKAASGKGGDGSSGSGTKVYSTLTFVRGTLDVEALLKAACTARNNVSWSNEDQQAATKNRFCIHHVPPRGDGNSEYGGSSDGLAWYQQGSYRLLSHSPEQLGKSRTNNGKALDNLIFPTRVKNLIKEIELWRKSKDWYLEKGIPWKRGMLLYGPPGTGKTALARAFAEDLNMPIYVYNLAEMGNHELMQAWTEMQTNTPCIALIEDIDNVFHGRENVVRRPGMFPMMVSGDKKDGDGGDNKGRGPLAPPLTFDCLLNCLDGVERADGIFTIITTNDLTKIDPALGLPRQLPDGTTEFISTRPGRIDKAVELTYMEVADKRRMAARILESYQTEYLDMLDFIEKFPDLQETPAQFQERCAQIALKSFWRDLAPEREPATEPGATPAVGGIFGDLVARLLAEPRMRN